MQTIKKITRIKMIARIVADQRCQSTRVAAAVNKPGPSNQRRRRQPRQKLGLKTLKEKFVVDVLKWKGF